MRKQLEDAIERLLSCADTPFSAELDDFTYHMRSDAVDDEYAYKGIMLENECRFFVSISEGIISALKKEYGHPQR